MTCTFTRILAAAALMVSATGCAQSTPPAQPNVLLICVDDLRTHLGCYGYDDIHSPHIDRLAEEGRLFSRHYVSVAACGPSRCSMLTGRYHGNSWDAWGAARKLKTEPDIPVSLPHLFRKNGYQTISIGKVSHNPGGVMDDDTQQVHQLPFSWDRVVSSSGPWKTSWAAFFGYADGQSYNRVVSPMKMNTPRLPYESADVPDTGYPDGLNAQAAIEQLQDLAGSDQPFFLAVGFYKPHLPFNAPKKYWDLYDPEKIGLATNPHEPEGVDAALVNHQSLELDHYKWPWGKGQIPDEQANKLRHGYYACTSYVDAQIGKVLDEYRRLGLDKNTIVVLWSDHGYHLGEHGMFCKNTNYEIATRSPLIVKVPDIPQPGVRTQSLVETIDLYPTLSELCGLTAPGNVEGKSMAALVQNPQAQGRDFARSIHFMKGHNCKSLRTDRWRFTSWQKDKATVMVELYDHEADPEENVNVASKYPEIVKQLSSKLKTAYPQDIP